MGTEANKIRIPPIRVRKISPFRGPHPGQVPILSYLFTPERAVKRAILCSGIGFGKTQLCHAIFQAKLEQGPTERVLFLEPDVNRMNKLFVEWFVSNTPDHLYRINEGKRQVFWHNGAIGYFDHRDVRGSKAIAADKVRGPNLSGIINDESAIGFHLEYNINQLGRLRLDSPNLFWLDATTPKVGPFGDWMSNGMNTIFRGRTIDNPFLRPSPEEFDASLRATMTEMQARRELDGELVALEGRIWQDVIYHPTEGRGWPHSNRDDDHPRFDSRRPWYILSDMGSATGAYACVQPVPAAMASGREVFQGTRWVLFADLCPKSEGDIHRAMNILKKNFGDKPAGLVSGLDINRRADTDGKTPAYFATKVFGNIPIYPYSESDADERTQGDALGALWKTADGKRRLTIARDFISLDPDSKRGVREMVEQDVWLNEDERRPQDYFPKQANIRVNHIRDALLKGALLMAPPEWLKEKTN